MIITPAGNILLKTNIDSTYKAFDIVLVDNNGNELDIIAKVEYNKEDKTIATYAYCENAEEFANKTIYKKVK